MATLTTKFNNLLINVLDADSLDLIYRLLAKYNISILRSISGEVIGQPTQLLCNKANSSVTLNPLVLPVKYDTIDSNKLKQLFIWLESDFAPDSKFTVAGTDVKVTIDGTDAKIDAGVLDFETLEKVYNEVKATLKSIGAIDPVSDAEPVDITPTP